MSRTFYQLVHAGDLLAAVYSIDSTHSLRQMQVVRQGARQLHQECVVGAEPVGGNGVHQTLEVPVSIAVEPDLFGPFLRGECLQRSGPVVATVGAVGRAGNQAAAPGAGAGPPAATAACRVISLGPGGASPADLVPFVKVLQLEGLAQRHGDLMVQSRSTHPLLHKIHFSNSDKRELYPGCRVSRLLHQVTF